MPTTRSDGVTLHYDTAGAGEPVVFVTDAGYGAWQWAWQYDGLAGPYRTIIWDLRGTGQSDSPDGPYDVETLATDLEAVLAATEVRSAHVVGAGLGGMIALRYARSYDRARTLTLFGTAPGGDLVDRDALRALHPPDQSPEECRESLSGAFSAEFRSEQSETIDRICAWRAEEDASVAGFEGQLAATTGFEAGPLYELTLPTLVCHGLADPVVDIDVGRELARDLPRGSFESVEGKQLCHVEHSRAVTDRLDGFLTEHSRES
ncbi:MAG: alpha/beta fold hydrolase [Halovenus sp.]